MRTFVTHRLGSLLLIVSLGAMAIASDSEPAKPVAPAEMATVTASSQEDLPAPLRAKYGALLKKIPVPQDLQSYGEFRVYGWYGGTAYAGYDNLPQGYWVYTHPDWYIFSGPPGTVSPYVSKEDRDLFSECQDKDKISDNLIKAWARFAKAAKHGDAETLWAMCLPHSVEVTENENATDPRALPLSLPFLKKRFDARVLQVRQDSDSCLLVRTGPMAFWFVETASEGWKLYMASFKDCSRGRLDRSTPGSENPAAYQCATSEQAGREHKRER